MVHKDELIKTVYAVLLHNAIQKILTFENARLLAEAKSRSILFSRYLNRQLLEAESVALTIDEFLDAGLTEEELQQVGYAMRKKQDPEYFEGFRPKAKATPKATKQHESADPFTSVPLQPKETIEMNDESTD